MEEEAMPKTICQPIDDDVNQDDVDRRVQAEKRAGLRPIRGWIEPGPPRKMCIEYED